MITYRDYRYARRRRPDTGAEYYIICNGDGSYVSYADTTTEARLLIDTYNNKQG